MNLNSTFSSIRTKGVLQRVSLLDSSTTIVKHPTWDGAQATAAIHARLRRQRLIFGGLDVSETCLGIGPGMSGN